MAVLNETKPVLLHEGYSFDWSDVPEQMVKYKPFSQALVAKLPWQARRTLDRMEEYLVQGYKSTLLDFKVVELKAGQCGCKLSDWHMDVTRNPNHPSKVCQHLIYTTEIGTEFLLDKIDTDATDFADVQLPWIKEFWQAPANAIVQFNRLNMHRGPIVPRDCKRVLIRLTQTDII